MEKNLRIVQVLRHYFSQFPVYEAIEKAEYLLRLKQSDPEFYLSFSGFISNSLLNSDIDQACKKFKEVYLLESLALAEPLEFPESIKKYVFELLTQRQLKDEGLKMKHCVGGYAEQVKNGQSRILSIRTPEGDSTMEIKKHINGYWYGVQHRATANTFPKELNRKHAIAAITYLNTGVEALLPEFDDGAHSYPLPWAALF